MGVCMSSPMERLVVAAKDGDVEAVKRLLRRVDSPNFHEPTSGLTPLLAAAKEGHVSVVGVLLEHGASVSARLSQKGKQALHFAAQNGSVEIAELLIVAGADVNATAGGLSPLMIAASTPHTEIIHFLLEHGALLEMKGSDVGQLTAMHLTIPARKLDNLRAMVIHAPDMVDVEAANGVTPLMLAATWGSTDAVRILLEAGADVFARAGLQHKDAHDKTLHLTDCQVLHFVACSGFRRELQSQPLLETAQALVDGGADPLACTAEGLLPVDLVRDRTGPLGVLLVELTEAAGQRKARRAECVSSRTSRSSEQRQSLAPGDVALLEEAAAAQAVGPGAPRPSNSDKSLSSEARSPSMRARGTPERGYRSLRTSEISGAGYSQYRAGYGGYGQGGAGSFRDPSLGSSEEAPRTPMSVSAGLTVAAAAAAAAARRHSAAQAGGNAWHATGDGGEGGLRGASGLGSREASARSMASLAGRRGNAAPAQGPGGDGRLTPPPQLDGGWRRSQVPGAPLTAGSYDERRMQGPGSWGLQQQQQQRRLEPTGQGSRKGLPHVRGELTDSAFLDESNSERSRDGIGANGGAGEENGAGQAPRAQRLEGAQQP